MIQIELILSGFRNKRVGVLAIKLGSIPQWTIDGKKIYLTMLQVDFMFIKINN